MDLDSAAPSTDSPPIDSTPLEQAVSVHVDTTQDDLSPPLVADAATPEPERPSPPPSKADKAPEFSVFDPPVQDRPAARRGGGGAKKRGGKKGSAAAHGAGGESAGAAPAVAPASTTPAPVTVTPELREKCRKEATGMVKMYDAHMRMTVRNRYREILEEKSLEQLEEQVALSADELELLVDPITEGMEEMGARLPWWARLGVAAIMVNKSRQALLDHVERQYQRHLKNQEQQRQLNAPGVPVPAAA